MAVTIIKKPTIPSELPVTLFTLGHSNLSPESYVAQAKEHDISLIIDVRSNPSSRYMPWVNRGNVGQVLHDLGMDYLYGGLALGGYAKYDVNDPFFLEKLGKVVDLAKGTKLAMMCAEKDPSGCHRAYKLTSTILRRWPTVKVNHLVGGKVLPGYEFEASKPYSFVEDYHPTHITDLPGLTAKPQ